MGIGNGSKGDRSGSVVGATVTGSIVHHASCLDLLPNFPEASVDHIITDPPYSEHVHKAIRSSGGDIKDGIVRNVDLGFEHLSRETMLGAAREFARLARRWVLIFCDHESSHLWEASLIASGLQHVRTCAWVKLASTPQFSGDRPGSGYEEIVCAHRPGRKKWNGGGRNNVFSHAIVNPAVSDRVHTTQKPLPLMLELVNLFTDPGEKVLDAFAGSGTTGVACARLGREFIGIERDEKYAQVARDRIQAELNHSDRLSAAAGQVPMFGGAR